jgi:hypothetical protein
MPIPEYKDTGAIDLPAKLSLEVLRGKSVVITGGTVEAHLKPLMCAKCLP